MPKYDLKKMIYNAEQNSLDYKFNWDSTPQGSEFWSKEAGLQNSGEPISASARIYLKEMQDQWESENPDAIKSNSKLNETAKNMTGAIKAMSNDDLMALCAVVMVAVHAKGLEDTVVKTLKEHHSDCFDDWLYEFREADQ